MTGWQRAGVAVLALALLGAVYLAWLYRAP